MVDRGRLAFDGWDEQLEWHGLQDEALRLLGSLPSRVVVIPMDLLADQDPAADSSAAEAVFWRTFAPVPAGGVLGRELNRIGLTRRCAEAAGAGEWVEASCLKNGPEATLIDAGPSSGREDSTKSVYFAWFGSLVDAGQRLAQIPAGVEPHAFWEAFPGSRRERPNRQPKSHG
jgi:hypothetical protein